VIIYIEITQLYSEPNENCLQINNSQGENKKYTQSDIYALIVLFYYFFLYVNREAGDSSSTFL
jgi:hypothetical protein